MMLFYVVGVGGLGANCKGILADAAALFVGALANDNWCRGWVVEVPSLLRKRYVADLPYADLNSVAWMPEGATGIPYLWRGTGASAVLRGS